MLAIRVSVFFYRRPNEGRRIAMKPDQQFHSLSTSGPALSGSLPRHSRAPAKFQVGIEHEDAFLEGCRAITTRFNALGGITDAKLPDALLVAALEANSGVICPGFLGSKRPFVEERLNNLFGRDGWEVKHIVAGRLAPEGAALRLYEQAYAVFFRANPEKLDWLCQTFSDVYDTDPSNVTSGLDYSIQELPSKGRHLHDIAIRRAVASLGRTFEGDRLLQVRGRYSKGSVTPDFTPPVGEGFCLSPGEIPFPFPEQIPSSEVPNLRPWWKPQSIEDFYQRTRRLVVKEFADPSVLIAHPGTAAERTETYCARLASRYLLRMLPIVTSSQVGISQLNELPWMLDANSFPCDSSGLPRPFTDEECHLVAKALHEQMEHLIKKSNNPNGLLKTAPWLGFDKSVDFLGVLERKAQRIEPSESERAAFPDFSDVQVWGTALDHFWKHTYGAGKRPLHLARDAWIIMEFISYKCDLVGQDREACKRSVYIPGTQLRPSLRKNDRGNCSELENLVEKLTEFAVASRDEAEQAEDPSSILTRYREKVIAWISKGGEEQPSIWKPIFQQIVSQFPDGIENVVVVDSDGTGKSAQFLATLLEYFGRQSDPSIVVDVLIGGMQGTAASPAIGVPNLAERYGMPIDAVSGRHLPDARWPFCFGGYNPGPSFNIEKHPARYQILLWRSIQLYNLAVRSSYSTIGSDIP